MSTVEIRLSLPHPILASSTKFAMSRHWIFHKIPSNQIYLIKLYLPTTRSTITCDLTFILSLSRTSRTMVSVTSGIYSLSLLVQLRYLFCILHSLNHKVNVITSTNDINNNIRIVTLPYNKQLMTERLPHFFYSGKIQSNLLEIGNKCS